MKTSWVRGVVAAVAGAFLAVISGLASAGALAVFMRRSKPRAR